jgi:hypothetical protein
MPISSASKRGAEGRSWPIAEIKLSAYGGTADVVATFDCVHGLFHSICLDFIVKPLWDTAFLHVA